MLHANNLVWQKKNLIIEKKYFFTMKIIFL